MEDRWDGAALGGPVGADSDRRELVLASVQLPSTILLAECEKRNKWSSLRSLDRPSSAFRFDSLKTNTLGPRQRYRHLKLDTTRELHIPSRAT